MMVLLPTVLSHLKTTTDLIISVLDLVSEEISNRFKALCFCRKKWRIHYYFKAASNADTSRIEVPEAIITMFKDIDSRKLDNQLQMLPDLVNAFKKSQNLPKLSQNE